MKPWLIFDLDDTLIPSSEIYDRCYRRLRLGTAFKKAKKITKSRMPAGHTSSHNRLLYFKHLEELHGSGNPARTLAQMRSYERLLAQEVRSAVRRLGLKKDLRTLKKKYRLALFTNETLRTQLIKIIQIDPRGEIFNRILTSEEIGMEKRSPGAYKKLLKFLGAKPSACTMIGDDPEQDIRAAKKSGIRKTILVKPTKDRGASYKLSTRLPELFL